LTLSQVLKQIEQEAIVAKGKKAYISWEEFEGYFLQHRITDQALLSKIRIFKAKTMISKTENDDNVMDLDKSLKQLLKEIFDGTPTKKRFKRTVYRFCQDFRTNRENSRISRLLEIRKGNSSKKKRYF